MRIEVLDRMQGPTKLPQRFFSLISRAFLTTFAEQLLSFRNERLRRRQSVVVWGRGVIRMKVWHGLRDDAYPR